MTPEQYFIHRGYVPTLLAEQTISSLTYYLYTVIDDYYLSRRPIELQSVMVPSYTYDCILMTDSNNKIKKIYPYLDTEEGYELYTKLTSPKN